MGQHTYHGLEPCNILDTETAEPRAPAIDLDAPFVAAAVRKALDKLPDPHREVILLHWFEGMSFAEIAAVLGSTNTACKNCTCWYATRRGQMY